MKFTEKNADAGAACHKRLEAILRCGPAAAMQKKTEKRILWYGPCQQRPYVHFAFRRHAASDSRRRLILEGW
jgi:hypothetical protein